MKLGASLPVGDVGTGSVVVKDYAQTLEGLGFDYIQAPDHVLGGNPQSKKGRPSKGTTAEFDGVFSGTNRTARPASGTAGLLSGPCGGFPCPGATRTPSGSRTPHAGKT